MSWLWLGLVFFVLFYPMNVLKQTLKNREENNLKRFENTGKFLVAPLSTVGFVLKTQTSH